MAISVDATSSSTTFPWNHTVGAGAGMILIVALNTNNGAVASAVTFNGVSLTLAQQSVQGTTIAQIWYLANPPAGTYAIEVTGMTGHKAGYAVSAYATDTTVDDYVDASGEVHSSSLANPTVNLTTTQANTILVDSVYKTGSSGISPGTGQTQINKFTQNSQWQGSSYKVVASSGANQMYWTVPTAVVAYAAAAFYTYRKVGGGFIFNMI